MKKDIEFALILLLVAVPVFALAKPTKTISGENSCTSGSMHLTCDTIWILEGVVCIDSGTTLTIDPGTTILARNIQSEKAFLIIPADARIHANGTEEKPIVFTIEGDDPNTANEQFDRDNFFSQGLWGGIAVLGNAQVNTPSGKCILEGTHYQYQSSLQFGGGTDPQNEESSGVLRYVSIRYAGGFQSLVASVPTSGLTLAGVGSGTVIENIEVFNSSEDGFRFIGGTVSCKYLASSFNDGQLFDFDYGWSGRIQFLFGIARKSNTRRSDDGIEFSSYTVGNDRSFGCPLISNFTLIGDENRSGILLKGDAKAFLFGGLQSGWETAVTSFLDSDDQWQNSELAIKNTVFNGFEPDSDELCNVMLVRDSLRLVHWGNIFETYEFGSLSKESINQAPFNNTDYKPMDFRLQDTIASDAFSPYDFDHSFFIETDYPGAFSPAYSMWLEGWTAIDHYGLVKREATSINGTQKQFSQKRPNWRMIRGANETEKHRIYSSRGQRVHNTRDIGACGVYIVVIGGLKEKALHGFERVKN